jgi:hypothetical protein
VKVSLESVEQELMVNNTNKKAKRDFSLINIYGS